MIGVILFTLVLSVDSFCTKEPSGSFFRPALKSRHRDCSLNISKNKKPAGPARNVRATCIKKSAGGHQPIGNYYYELTWDAPELTEYSSPVTRYRIRIWYYIFQQHVCYQVGPNERKFIFNVSSGLAYGCPFTFSVTPEPIVYTNGYFRAPTQSVNGCPLPPSVHPLPNAVVARGDTHTFRVSMRYEPVPIPRVTWYFSTDHINCRNARRVRNHHGNKYGDHGNNNVALLEEGRVLQVTGVQQANEGCYMLRVSNGIGETVTRRGYLNLKASSAVAVCRKNDDGILLPAFVALSGVMSVMVLVLSVAMCKRKKTITTFL